MSPDDFSSQANTSFPSSCATQETPPRPGKDEARTVNVLAPSFRVNNHFVTFLLNLISKSKRKKKEDAVVVDVFHRKFYPIQLFFSKIRLMTITRAATP